MVLYYYGVGETRFLRILPLKLKMEVIISIYHLTLTETVLLKLLLIFLFPMMSRLGQPNDCAKLNMNEALRIDFGCSGRMVNIRIIVVMIRHTKIIVIKLKEFPVAG